MEKLLNHNARDMVIHIEPCTLTARLDDIDNNKNNTFSFGSVFVNVSYSLAIINSVKAKLISPPH